MAMGRIISIPPQQPKKAQHDGRIKPVGTLRPDLAARVEAMRKPGRPPIAEPVLVRLGDLKAKAIKLGNGNLSLGVRLALASKRIPKPAPVAQNPVNQS